MGLGPLRGKGPARFGLPGLHQHRTALGAARHIQRSARTDMRARIVDGAHLADVQVLTRCGIVHHRSARKAAPQRIHCGHEFLGDAVALGMLHVLLQPVVFTGPGQVTIFQPARPLDR